MRGAFSIRRICCRKCFVSPASFIQSREEKPQLLEFTDMKSLASFLLLAAFCLSSLHADCITGPKRSPRGWTAWETIDTKGNVDLQVRYRSRFSLPGSAGREDTMIQFRYENRSTVTRGVALSIEGTTIDGAALFWQRESFRIEPFALDETGTVEGRTSAEGDVFTLNGRICSYTVNFAVN